MNNTITLTDTELVVEPTGLDKLWSLTRELRIPLAHVRGATYDPGFADEPKGMRAPGLRLGDKISGTFHREGERTFYNVNGFENAVAIELAGEHYARLILSVDDPRATVDRINAAVTA